MLSRYVDNPLVFCSLCIRKREHVELARAVAIMDIADENGWGKCVFYINHLCSRNEKMRMPGYIRAEQSGQPAQRHAFASFAMTDGKLPNEVGAARCRDLASICHLSALIGPPVGSVSPYFRARECDCGVLLSIGGENSYCYCGTRS